MMKLMKMMEMMVMMKVNMMKIVRIMKMMEMMKRRAMNRVSEKARVTTETHMMGMGMVTMTAMAAPTRAGGTSFSKSGGAFRGATAGGN